jgi:hypothetical protein
VVGSLDFVALNYYFPYVTSPGTMTDADTPSFFKDMNITRLAFESSTRSCPTGEAMSGRKCD